MNRQHPDFSAFNWFSIDVDAIKAIKGFGCSSLTVIWWNMAQSFLEGNDCANVLNSSMNFFLVSEVLYPTSPTAMANMTTDKLNVIRFILRRKLPTSAGFIRGKSLVTLHHITTHKNSVPKTANIKASKYSLKKLKSRLAWLPPFLFLTSTSTSPFALSRDNEVQEPNSALMYEGEFEAIIFICFDVK